MITLSIESSAPHFVTTDRYNRFKKILQQPTSMLNTDSALFKPWLKLIHCQLPTATGSELIIADDLCPQIAELLTDALQPVAALGSVANPLAAITARLAGQNLHTLHLVAHGQAGAFSLGGQRIDAELLRANADLLAQWQVQRIALWSCSVGQDAEFIRLLSELTGAQVFAAEQPLGKLNNTHNWQLNHGFNQNPFSLTILANWSYQLATYNFSNAYEVIKANTPAGKESNTHDFDHTAGLGAVTVNDDVNSRYFSGNDVSAIGIMIGNTEYYGWISRPIKANGIVRGFYFWTDEDFTDLAKAQADGNSDGDRNVLDNRGFILVVDQAYFDGLGFKSGNIKNVGSSSDRVDSALNALIQPEVKLTAVADTSITIEAGGISNGTAGSDATGNALTNDTGTAPSKSVTHIGTTAANETVASNSTKDSNFTTVTGQYGSLKIGADGSYNYAISDQNNAAIQALRTTANTLTDTFTYTVTDSTGLKSSTTLTITIQGANDAPVANNDYNVAKESLLTDGTEYTVADSVGKIAAGNVLNNDTDVDGYSETKAIAGVFASATSGAVTTQSGIAQLTFTVG